MNSSLYKIAAEYIDFKIEGKIVRVPYVIARYAIKKYGNFIDTPDTATTGKYRNFGGKGTPKQLRHAVVSEAKKEGFDLPKKTAKQIGQFMEEKGIGIDCSGFTYNVLKEYVFKEKQKNLDTLVLRFPGELGKIERFFLQKNRVRRISAVTLTSDLNGLENQQWSERKKMEKSTEKTPMTLQGATP